MRYHCMISHSTFSPFYSFLCISIYRTVAECVLCYTTKMSVSTALTGVIREVKSSTLNKNIISGCGSGSWYLPHLLLRLSQPFSTGTAQRLLYSTYITIHVTNILSFEFSVEADYIVPQTSHLSVVQVVNYNSLLIWMGAAITDTPVSYVFKD